MTPLELSGSATAALATIIAAVVTGVFALIVLRGNRRIKTIETEAAKQAAEISAQTETRGQDLTDRQTFVAQMQNELAELRDELASVKKASADQDHARAQEIADLRHDLGRSQRRERILENHAWQLQRYIAQHIAIATDSTPPPPAWPEKALREAE